MQTIVSLAERLDMTAEEAVGVLRKLKYDIADVNTEIDDDLIDLLLDIDEDDDALESKLAEIEKEEEKQRKKAESAKKAAAKAKPKAKAKAEAKPKAKAKAKPKTAVRKRRTADEEDESLTASADLEMARQDLEETIEEEAAAIVEPAVAAILPEEECAAVILPEETTTESADGEAEDIGTDQALLEEEITAEASQDIHPDEVIIQTEVLEEPPAAEPAKLRKPEPSGELHPPRAQIIVESEEEALAAAAQMKSKGGIEEEEEHGSGILAEAERRHEAEERRRIAREKERQQKKEQEKEPGARFSPVQADPDVVAEVIRRDQERKRKAQEDKERRERFAEQRKSGRLSAPIGKINQEPAPITLADPTKEVVKPEAGLSKSARKRAKKAERMRIREDSIRREAAAAVKEFQAGAAFGGMRKKRKKRREEQVTEITEQRSGGVIEVDEMVTVEALANLINTPVNDLILALMDENILVNKNQTLDMDTVRRVAAQFDYDVNVVIPEEEELFSDEGDDPAELKLRPPVVTVMGHVDHGKTSLLDAIRSTNVAGGEAGGITQHIAAYDIEVQGGKVTFLDTPGHEAFTQMRARGAHVTDVVVLVVAANDGVKPQTIEAIDHAKAAEVPIVVAINKCDLNNAQPDRVRQELSQYGLIDEAWGGKTMMMNISAKMKIGVDSLMEMLALQAELLDLKANPNKRAKGAIIESELTTGLGPVAWVLVQSGTLHVGDAFLAGSAFGRVRSMMNCRGEEVPEAGPSMPVIVTGFNMPPDAGDTFIVAPDERMARGVAEKREAHARLKRGPATKHMTLEDFHARFMGQEQKSLNIIIKADVQGSVDVLLSSFAKIGNEEVSVSVVHSGVGGINESDVLLAEASDAVIIGFHVTANAKVKKMAEQAGVDIRTYRIIYEALDEVRSALEGMLTPDSKEVVVGHAEVRQIFSSSALGNIAGCYQTDGETQRGALARLVRDSVVVYEGKINSLRRQKDDVRSVLSGFECGIKLERFDDVHVGDVIECYKMESVAKTLESEV